MFGSMFGFGDIPYISDMTDQEAIDVIDRLKNEYDHMHPYDLREQLDFAGIDNCMLSPHMQDVVNQGW